MSRSNRPQARGQASRPRRKRELEAVQRLEERCLLAPVMAINARTATFTAAPTPTNPFLGTVTVGQGAAEATSAAGFTSVSQLTSNDSFGGDIVRIEAGPGGDFGKAVYAISRGAGGNIGAVNRPGVIYRVDPATGKASVFFDLNTVLATNNASNSLGADTGLVNWYDIAFDPEGYFDGRTSMFVSSVDRLNPNKNVIFRIGSDGSFLGAFVQFTDGAGSGVFSRAPSSLLVPPPEQQTYLRGLFAGDGSGTGVDGFAALFFDANAFRPGTDLNAPGLPRGVTATNLTFGPQTGLTSSSINPSYPDRVYSSFANFGVPASPDAGAVPGLSGVQGLSGGLLSGDGVTIVSGFSDPDFTTIDQAAAIITPFRRYQDITFDYYGYFSYGATVTAGVPPTVAPIPPTFVGNVFVADLATELSVTVTPVAPLATTPIDIPIQGPGPVGVELDASGNVVPIVTNGNTTGGSNIGGRIIRIAPDGTITNFATNFDTSGSQQSDSFIDSSLSITFSADGTTLYASDDEGIWQFKSVLSLAGSSSGSIVGLNDLRTLGVPYDGQDLGVAVVDTGIDARTPPLRGRVATGKDVVFGGLGNDDKTSLLNGHGTPLAGVVAQFVPQSTLVPVNVYTANAGVAAGTTSHLLFKGFDYLRKNPYAKDPVRPNKLDRIITTVTGVGTISTFETEVVAFELDAYPQIVLAFKGQLHRMRQMGNQVIAATGQFGIPVGGVLPANEFGDVNGESLPGILNEVISVTGTYPFPFDPDASTPPTDPSSGVLPRPIGPLTLIGATTNASTGAELLGNAGILGVGDNIIYADKIVAAANRSVTTDYAAPAVDVPTFSRTFAGDGGDYLLLNEAGTSLSAGMVTGSYTMVAAALDYWIELAQTPDGATVDGYLTTPVGVNQLAFGSHSLVDLSAYARPDGVNSILEWTAVPARDNPNLADTSNPPPLFGLDEYRHYARVDIGNAIAAIEGSIAIDYLFRTNAWSVIDGNNNGLITAAEIQSFVDRAATIGMPEAGAMARLLGGTETTPLSGYQPTAFGETPDQRFALQRRFNFFDYAADENLNGSVTIDQLRVLGHTLLPSPDAFVVTDRQRASVNQFLIDAHAPRNFWNMQHLLPTYLWVPPGMAKKYANGRMLAFVGRRQPPATITPFYTLFEPSLQQANIAAKAAQVPQKPVTPTPTPTPPVTPTPAPQNPTPTTPVTPGNTPSTIVQQPTERSQQILDALVALAQQRQTSTPIPAGTLGAAIPVTITPTPVTPTPVPTTPSTTPATPAPMTPASSSPASDTTRPVVEQRESMLTTRNERIEQAQENFRNNPPEDKTLWEDLKDNLFNWW